MIILLLSSSLLQFIDILFQRFGHLLLRFESLSKLLDFLGILETTVY